MSDTAEIERKFYSSGFGDKPTEEGQSYTDGNDPMGVLRTDNVAIGTPLDQDVHDASTEPEEAVTVEPIVNAPSFIDQQESSRYQAPWVSEDGQDSNDVNGLAKLDTHHEDYLQASEDIKSTIKATKAETADELAKQAELKKSLDEINENEYSKQTTNDSAADVDSRNSRLNISSNSKVPSKVSAKHPKKGSTAETGIPTDFNRLRKLGASVLEQV